MERDINTDSFEEHTKINFSERDPNTEVVFFAS